MKFIIPLRDEDLLQPVEDVYYVERIVTSEDEVQQALDAFEESLVNGEFGDVAQYFDEFFSLARQGTAGHRSLAQGRQDEEEHSWKMKAICFEVLAQGLQKCKDSALVVHLDAVINSEHLTAALCSESERLSNCVMMYVYLISRIGLHLEEHAKHSSRLVAEQGGSKRAGGKQGSRQRDPHELDEAAEFWMSNEEPPRGRAHLLLLLHELISMKVQNTGTGSRVSGAIRYLWERHVIDQRLLTFILSTITRLLENPETAKPAGAPTLRGVFAILRQLCVHYPGVTKTVCKSLMDTALRMELFQQQSCNNFHFIDAVLRSESKKKPCEMRPLLVQMIAYVGKLEEKGGRVVCLLLTTLAERCPKFAYFHLSYILPLLSFDPSSLRNAVLTALASILLGTEGENDLGSDAAVVEQNRMEMLCKLREHIGDVNSFVRARALNLWGILVTRLRHLPTVLLITLAADANDRLNDTTLLVRKAATSFLCKLLAYNPFGSDLNTSGIKTAWHEANNKRTELLNKLNKITARTTAVGLPSSVDTDLQTVPSTSSANHLIPTSNNLPEMPVELDNGAIVGEDEQEKLIAEELRAAEEELQRFSEIREFTVELGKALKKVVASLQRTNEKSELQELVSFIDECHKFRLNRSKRAMNSVFAMIWRKDSAIVDLVLQAADSLFQTNQGGEILGEHTVGNLLEVMLAADVEERLSLEEALVQAVERKAHIPARIIDLLWEEVAGEAGQGQNLGRRLAAVRLIGVFCRARPVALRAQLPRISELYRQCNRQGGAQGGGGNEQRYGELSTELLRCCVLPLGRQPSASSTQKRQKQSFRLPPSDPLIEAIIKSLVEQVTDPSTAWLPHCREAVSVLCSLVARPYIVISTLYTKLAQCSLKALGSYSAAVAAHNNCSGSSSVEDGLPSSPPDLPTLQDESTTANGGEARELAVSERRGSHPTDLTELKDAWELVTSRVTYFIGELAMKFVIYMDGMFTNEMKEAQQKIHEVRQSIDTAGYNPAVRALALPFSTEEDLPLSQFEKDSIRQRGFFEKADREDDRAGLTAISEEEKLQMNVHGLLDKETFAKLTILGRMLPFVLQVLGIGSEGAQHGGHFGVGTSSSSKKNGAELNEQAVVCLARLMLIREACCKKFLPVLFAHYNDASVRVKSNLNIFLTDLCFRFPNCFNAYIDEFVGKLRDKNALVRRTCLSLFGHMLLSDIIKSTGRIADIAACLYDPDEHVSRLAKALFTDLGRKQNLLYNSLPDVLERLMVTARADMTEQTLDELLQLLASFVTKDQQRLRLIERLKEKLSDEQLGKVQQHFKVAASNASSAGTGQPQQQQPLSQQIPNGISSLPMEMEQSEH